VIISDTYKGLADALEASSQSEEAWAVWQELLAHGEASLDHWVGGGYFAAKYGKSLDEISAFCMTLL
jgi:hypothetical protein